MDRRVTYSRPAALARDVGGKKLLYRYTRPNGTMDIYWKIDVAPLRVG